MLGHYLEELLVKCIDLRSFKNDFQLVHQVKPRRYLHMLKITVKSQEIFSNFHGILQKKNLFTCLWIAAILGHQFQKSLIVEKPAF